MAYDKVWPLLETELFRQFVTDGLQHHQTQSVAIVLDGESLKTVWSRSDDIAKNLPAWFSDEAGSRFYLEDTNAHVCSGFCEHLKSAKFAAWPRVVLFNNYAHAPPPLTLFESVDHETQAQRKEFLQAALGQNAADNAADFKSCLSPHIQVTVDSCESYWVDYGNSESDDIRKSNELRHIDDTLALSPDARRFQRYSPNDMDTKHIYLHKMFAKGQVDAAALERRYCRTEDFVYQYHPFSGRCLFRDHAITGGMTYAKLTAYLAMPELWKSTPKARWLVVTRDPLFIVSAVMTFARIMWNQDAHAFQSAQSILKWIPDVAICFPYQAEGKPASFKTLNISSLVANAMNYTDGLVTLCYYLIAAFGITGEIVHGPSYRLDPAKDILNKSQSVTEFVRRFCAGFGKEERDVRETLKFSWSWWNRKDAHNRSSNETKRFSNLDFSISTSVLQNLQLGTFIVNHSEENFVEASRSAFILLYIANSTQLSWLNPKLRNGVIMFRHTRAHELSLGFLRKTGDWIVTKMGWKYRVVDHNRDKYFNQNEFRYWPMHFPSSDPAFVRLNDYELQHNKVLWVQIEKSLKKDTKAEAKS